MGLFKRGYEAQREELARQEEARENMGKKLWRFFLPQPEKRQRSTEADVRFLTEEPVNFMEHTMKERDNGKEVYRHYTCTGDNCPLCEGGDRPSFKGAYLLVDHREYEYTDKDGKEQTGSDQVRLFVMGARVVSQLDRLSNKGGLSNRDVTIVRLGKGTDTTYTIEKGEKYSLSKKEIEQLLPEMLREDYDGTMDSLYDIVEEQLLLNTYNSSYEEEDEDDEYDDEDSSIIGVEEDEEEDDEEEYERPRRRPSSSNKPKSLKKSSGGLKKKNKSMFKSRSENSLKPRGNTRAIKLLKK